MPILGIAASSILVVPPSFESIATISVSSAQNTVTFSNIPQTYQHLQLRMIYRSTYAGSVAAGAAMNVNGAAFDKIHYLYSAGNSTYTGATGYFSNGTAGSSPSYTFAGIIVDFLDYCVANKNRTVRSLGGTSQNSADGFLIYTSSLKASTAAITSISVFEGDPNFKIEAGSHLALYGIKG